MNLSEDWCKWFTLLAGIIIIVQSILGVYFLINEDPSKAIIFFSTIALWASSIAMINR